MARGSLTEILDHLLTAHDEGYIEISALEDFRKDYHHLLKLANGYIAYLKKQKLK